MSKNNLRLAIYGVSGYTGGELISLLQEHPNVSIDALISHSNSGTALGEIHRHLHLSPELAKMQTIGTDKEMDVDCVFFATPAAFAMKHSAKYLNNGATKVIDLSPDFRIKDLDVWQKCYGMNHEASALVPEAVYGLPEANRDAIAKARLIANPGCYATAAQLALLPLISNDAYKEVFAKEEIVVDAKSGVSGAGKRAMEHLLLAEAGEDFTCYAAEGHRHQPEIEESLCEASGTKIKIRFVPHLLPITRGIFSDAYVPLRKGSYSGSETKDNAKSLLQNLHSEFVKFYADHPFVRMLPLGQSPHIKHVRGSNYCDIALFAAPDSSYIQVCSVLDNLVKGAAGQAVQNMNIAFGLEETCGLGTRSVSP